MAILFTNNARSTLASGITSGALSLTVGSGHGALFPNPTSPDYFLVTLETGGVTGTREIVKVTARSTDTFTIVRAQEGTSAAAWNAGDLVELRLTKGILEAIQPGFYTIPVIVGDGTNVITTGLKGGVISDVSGTIVSATVLALDGLTGSIVFDIWKDVYANHPPTVADTITASAKPTVSSATKSQDTTLTGWTKTITAGDILFFNVDSVSTFKLVGLYLKVQKTWG